MKFIQYNRYGRVVDRFELNDLRGYLKEEARKLKVEEEIQFIGITTLRRVE